MVTRSQKVRLGIFVTLAIMALVITLVILVAPKILEKRDIFQIGYRNVSLTGLTDGSSVKYQGLTVGFVSDISIDPDDISRVIVEISLEEGTPIREDTEAEIAYLGITGLKLIELKSGSQDAAPLKPGSFITASRSVADQITGKAEILAEKTEIILNNLVALTAEENREQFSQIAQNTSKTLEQLNIMLRKNDRAFSNTMTNVEQFSYHLEDLTISTKGILSRANQFAHSDTLKRVMANMAELTEALKEAEIVRLFGEINITLEKINTMLMDVEATFSKSRTDLVFTIESLKESVEYLNQFSRMVSEDPSIIVRGTEPKDAPDFKLEK